MFSWLKKKARLYDVGFKDFYQHFDQEICEKEIENLVKRYNVYNKDILSIGSGTAHEEYWFCIKGKNNLILFDIDESGAIEPALKKMKKNFAEAIPREKSLSYYIGDFLVFRNDFSNKFDVLYLSSFTPDELRRSRISNSYMEMKKGKKGVLFLEIEKRFVPQDKKDLHWPIWHTPFHKAIYQSFQLLKKNGLVIIQSYCGGIDIKHNPNYIKKIKHTFLKHGVILLDIFHLREAPGVTLIVGFSGTAKDASKFYKENVQVPLDSFHGRTKINNAAEHFYSL